MATVDTTLSTALTVRSTQVTLAAYTAPVSGFGARTLLLVNNAETMEVLSSIGRTLTVQRGFNGTTALAHAAGVTVTYGLSTEMTGPSVVEGPSGPQAVIDSASVDWTFGSGVGSAASSGSGSSILTQAMVTLTNAQIKALPTTGVEILPAQAGKVLVPVFGVLHLHWVADYGNIDAASQIRLYIGGSPSLASLDDSVNGAVTGLLAGGGPDTYGFNLPFGNASSQVFGWSGAYTSDVVNRPVSISASNSGNFTGGDPLNTLTVSIAYLVLNATTGVFV